MKKLVSIAAMLVVFFAVGSQIDDKLNSDSVRLLELAQGSDSSEAFLYLYGIFAHPDESPEEVGAQLFNQYQQKEKNNSFTVESYPEERKLTVPEGELFCNSWGEACFESLFKTDFDYSELAKKHAMLIERFDTFYQFTEYSTLTKPTYYELIAPYHYVAKAGRLDRLEAISYFKEGYPESAIELLQQQYIDNLSALSFQDNLIGKVSFVMQLSEIIDVLSIIQNQSEIEVESLNFPVSVFENLDAVFAREFAMGHFLYSELDRQPDFFERDGKLPGWFVRAIFKPNLSTNSTASFYVRLNRISALPLNEFAQEMATRSNIEISSSSLRNYAGNVLLRVQMPDFDQYIGRFMDIQAKVWLFNELNRSNGAITAAVNPYGMGGITVEDSNVCLDGPLEDTRSLRCVRVALGE